MAFPEIGDRLRAYRLGSGLSIDDVARRLKVSRSAIYRYEDGDVVKIETVQRIAQLLNVSLAALLGVGIEHIANALAFFERQRQLEAQARRMVVVFGPLAYLLTTGEYDAVLAEVIAEAAVDDDADRATALREVLAARKESYRRTRPGIVNLISLSEIARFLAEGLTTEGAEPSDATLAVRRSHARREVAHITALFRKPPMGVQLGLVTQPLPTTGFQVLFYDARPVVLSSPFRLGSEPNLRVGIATITNGDDAVRVYTRIADALWANALQGREAIVEIERLL